MQWLRRMLPPANLDQAIDNLEYDLSRNAPVERIRALLSTIGGRARHADEDALRLAVNRLSDGLGKGNVAASSAILYALGSVIEAGGDPWLATEPVLACCKRAFALAAQYHGALWAAMDDAEASTGKQVTDRDVQAIELRLRDAMPEAADAGNLISAFATPLIAVLSRSKEARKAACADPEFVRSVDEFARYADKPEGQLSVMLRVLDNEELLVLYPEYGKGFRVRIGGIAHNYQLHVLLADAIVGKHVPGERPDPRVVSIMREELDDFSIPAARGCFEMYDRTAVGIGGRLIADPLGRVIPLDGTPADIPAFDGVRVVLLVQPTFERTWKAPRLFEYMPGELEVAEVLAERECDDWLRRMASAPKPE